VQIHIGHPQPTSPPTPISRTPDFPRLSESQLDVVQRLSERNVPAPVLAGLVDSLLHRSAVAATNEVQHVTRDSRDDPPLRTNDECCAGHADDRMVHLWQRGVRLSCGDGGEIREKINWEGERGDVLSMIMHRSNVCVLTGQSYSRTDASNLHPFVIQKMQNLTRPHFER
jgi:hypothetical protein